MKDTDPKALRACPHHWTTTSECPRCLRAALDRAETERAQAQRELSVRASRPLAIRERDEWRLRAETAERELAEARAESDEYRRQALAHRDERLSVAKERDEARAALVEAETIVRHLAENEDHDDDAHTHGTWCFVCAAEAYCAALKGDDHGV